jgi:long-chain acyl-CoA synthetase
MLSIAAWLNTQNIRPGENVAIVSENSVAMVQLQFALWAIGAVVVPVPPQLSSAEIQSILLDCSASKVFFQDAALAERVGPTELIAFNLKEAGSWIEEGRTLFAEPSPRVSAETLRKTLWDSDPLALFILIYTSGTSGEPKGVMLSQRNLMSCLHDTTEVFRDHLETEKESRLMVLPLAHIFGQFELALSWVFGMKTSFSERSHRLVDELQEVQPTLLFGVPKVFEKVLVAIEKSLEARPSHERKITEKLLEAARRVADSRENLQRPSLTDSAENLLAQQTVVRAIQKKLGGRLKFAISGGAPLSAELGRELNLMGFKILEGYGLTETCGPISINDPTAPCFGTVGKLLTEVEIQFSSDSEIKILSPKNFLGYWRKPEATAEVLKEGWLHTGDLGFLDSEGRLHITDRRKELIKLSTGRSVPPQKIESLARSSRILEDFVVLGDGQSSIGALVTLNREIILKYCAERQILFSSFKELIDHPKVRGLVQSEIEQINEALAEHEKIRRFVILPEALSVYTGVMTPNQKPRRHLIAERYRAEIEALFPSSPLSLI